MITVFIFVFVGAVGWFFVSMGRWWARFQLSKYESENPE